MKCNTICTGISMLDPIYIYYMGLSHEYRYGHPLAQRHLTCAHLLASHNALYYVTGSDGNHIDLHGCSVNGLMEEQLSLEISISIPVLCIALVFAPSARILTVRNTSPEDAPFQSYCCAALPTTSVRRALLG